MNTELQNPENEIYKEFVELNELKNPELTFDIESAETTLTFDAEDRDPIETWRKAMVHFDMSTADSRIKNENGKLILTLQF